MPEKRSGLGRRAHLTLVSVVLIIGSTLFLCLSSCELWLIAEAGNGAGGSGVWVTGVELVLVSLPALYLIQRI
ncbi:MAG TPA: hypothetical protein VMI93_09935 [Candidatus Solibacter sp.]|nr:hypothetical protein [Candidatus Solibacter sp.]